MHIVYLNLISDTHLDNSDTFLKFSNLPQPLFEKLTKGFPEVISVVQRATFNEMTKSEEVNYYFVKDEFESSLLWWQEPVSVIEQISELKADIIHVHGLNLPLQFRWLRREVGDKIKIVGEHTGESFWANRNLWLQQFGLRVVDGFIFEDMEVAHSWTKASVILEKQPVANISLSNKNPKTAAKSLHIFYSELLTTKNTKTSKE